MRLVVRVSVLVLSALVVIIVEEVLQLDIPTWLWGLVGFVIGFAVSGITGQVRKRK